MNTNPSASLTPLRLWPAIAATCVLVAIRWLAPLVLAEGALVAIIGSVAASAAILLWWLFFSRARWWERLGIVALMIVATLAVRFVLHPSIVGGAMGRLPYVLALLTLPLGLVIGAVIAQRVLPERRFAVIAASVLIACGLLAVVRTDGVMSGGFQLRWRWTPTAEDRLLAKAQDLPAPAPAAPAKSPEPTTAAPAATESAPAKADKPAVPAPAKLQVKWPGFRGQDRDSVVRGVQIQTDWAAAPPVELWRRSIGPGWSSFAVAGDLLFTQEQRGADEIVAAYQVSTGKPVWMHKDPVRFYESNGGAGPRGTPTLDAGRVYAMGATGILNVLDAATGAAIWKRDTVADAGLKLPGWGITSSPLVHGDLVIVAVSGALAAYDRTSGDKRWFVKSTGGSYSSPQLIDVNGTPQVVLLGGGGATAVSPGDGTVLWRTTWPGTPIVQPASLQGGELLLTTADMMGSQGVKRVAVTRGSDGWKVEERWASRGLKPYFNDYVAHKGHAYGFDGSILACISLDDGSRKWKGGRYGEGQMMLLADQDLLLVISDEGELALVKAAPDQFAEVARFKAIEGKTWNHPALVGNVLLVRNGEEMAAFRLQ
jgi:outer membrane protein assembly factor BamB